MLHVTPRQAGKLTELGFQKLPADHNATERQKCEVYIGALLISHAQTAKLVQPCKSAFHDPAPSPQAVTVRIRPGVLGVLMVREIADDLIYNEPQNEVLLVKYLR